MIKETSENLFNSNAEALINAVNCVGVMGKGIALQFKQNFPAEYFKAYKIACQNGELIIGKVQIFELKNANTNPRFIINFPTKKHWREPSKIEYIESGLRSLVFVPRCHSAVSAATTSATAVAAWAKVGLLAGNCFTARWLAAMFADKSADSARGSCQSCAQSRTA